MAGKLITKRTDYAIRALVVMSRQEKGWVSVTDLARQLKLPYAAMRGIMQELARAGIVVSRRGAGGGFGLDKAASEIKVGDVMRIFQGRVQLTNCLVRGKLCREARTCLLRRKLRELEHIVVQQISSLSIAELAAES